MHASPKIFALTLVTDDLDETESFYRRVFGLEPVFTDANSTVFQFGEVLVNILDASAVGGLFSPAVVASPGLGHRNLLTIQVDNVDLEAERLAGLGVQLNQQPTDQDWGIRTITFIDPTGQMWEFSHPLVVG